MSDALTDLARDERRNTALYNWIFRVADYLEGKGDIAAVEDAAAKCDGIRRGYEHGQTAMARYTPTVQAAGEGDHIAIQTLRGLVDLEHWAAERYLAALATKGRKDGE